MIRRRTVKNGRIMRRLAVWMLALACAGSAAGCSDDDNSAKVPSAVRSAFDRMYPAATHVSWKGRNPYVLADFRDGADVCQAWYDAAGAWFMTKTEMTYGALPQAVRTAFEASDYASWEVDDVDRLQRNGLETVYVIEVESGPMDYDLFYTEDGVLLRAVADPDDDEYEGLLPADLPQAVKEFIERRYPGARILESEFEDGELEVEIVDGRTPREVYFDADDVWIRTKTEVTASEVPEAAMQAVRTSQYGGWEIDGIDHFDSAVREWYRFELDDPLSDREVELSVLPDGTIL